MKSHRPGHLNSLAARAAADFASAVRHPRGKHPGAPGGGPDTSIVTRVHGKGRWQMGLAEGPPPPSGEDQVVIPISTHYVQERRPAVTDVLMVVEHGAPISLARYDAVFWSEAAVEKFVFPYYASKCQWAAAFWLQKLAKHFYGFVPDEAGNPGQWHHDPVEGAKPDEQVMYPFAIGHLPRSDYADLEGGTAMGHDLWLLVRTEVAPEPGDENAAPEVVVEHHRLASLR